MRPREEDFQRVAREAARNAAELVNNAAIAAHNVTVVAATAANILAESNAVDIRHMQKDLDDIKKLLECKFVREETFSPVRILVYGQTGLILIAVVGAIVALVLR